MAVFKERIDIFFSNKPEDLAWPYRVPQRRSLPHARSFPRYPRATGFICCDRPKNFDDFFLKHHESQGMNYIRRYKLPIKDIKDQIRISLPEPCRILSSSVDIGTQECSFFVYEYYDVPLHFENYKIAIIENDTPFQSGGLHYLTTWQEHGVYWHLFWERDL